MAAVSGERSFKYYWDNFFKFPKDIRNDLVYCQRALKAHIKVHQMVLDVSAQEGDKDPGQKSRILNELERNIFEINAEQQHLLLRLRRTIEAFKTILRKNNIPVEDEQPNMCISEDLVPLINDVTLCVEPITVPFHDTEELLIARYFDPKEPTTVDEVSYSDDTKPPVTKKSTNTIINSRNGRKTCGGGSGGNISSRKSLPKPMAHREGGSGNQYANSYKKFMQAKMEYQTVEREFSRKLTMPKARFVAASHHSAKPTTALANEAAPTVELRASKKVKMSRRNLLEALMKVQDKTKDAKAATNDQSPLTTASSPPAGKTDMKSIASKMQSCSKQSVAATTLAKTAEPAPEPTAESKRDGKERNTCSTVKASKVPCSTVKVSKARCSSLKASKAPCSTVKASKAPCSTVKVSKPPCSTVKARKVPCSTVTVSKAREFKILTENSTPERDISPLVTTTVCTEYVDRRTTAEEIGQESFLRLFDLYTPKVIDQMQQQRSKRKRRNVHSNERDDFHYGRIECVPPPKKKNRRDFLLAPQVKRKLQAKRPKRVSVDKNHEVPTSRSNSSSPDEKRCCNECLKAIGAMEQCVACKGYAHRGCHPIGEYVKTLGASAARLKTMVKRLKKCPACMRIHLAQQVKDLKRYESLKKTVYDLGLQIAREQARRSALQIKNKQYKTELNEVCDIVEETKISTPKDNVSETNHTASSSRVSMLLFYQLTSPSGMISSIFIFIYLVLVLPCHN